MGEFKAVGWPMSWRQTIVSLAHLSSHKTPMCRNLTTTIAFDELIVKGEQAHQICVITCCVVTLIPSNSNDTASATDSAEAS